MRCLVAIVLVGCGGSDRVAVQRAQLGTPAARQVNSFHTEGGHRERTPPNIAEAELDDEATLVSDRCVTLILRDDSDADITEYEPAFVIDGARVAADITHDEQARLVVLPDGQKSEDCEPGIGAPVRAFCVYIQTAKLCAPRAGRAIELVLVHPTLVYRSPLTERRKRYMLAFAWTIR